MGEAQPKQYLSLAGRPLLYHALAALCRVPAVSRVYVVLAVDDGQWQRHDWTPLAAKLRPLFCGGASRAETVRNGLRAIAGEVGAARLGPGARCGASLPRRPPCRAPAARGRRRSMIGGILAVPLADTLKRADAESRIAATVPREGLWQAQTPQMFRYARLRQALRPHARRHRRGLGGGSAGAAAEAGGGGRDEPQSDLSARSADWPSGYLPTGRAEVATDFRIGQGFDVHALVPGRRLVIGGVDIPFERGLLGHSDADVLLHAVDRCPAGRGRPGRHRPALPRHRRTAYCGADSRVLLREAARRVAEAGCRGGQRRRHGDRPARRSWRRTSRRRWSPTSRPTSAIDPDRVNVKAKTTERLGFTGRGEGIAAQAVALVARRRPRAD
ncbi:MAG: 2-C-methyl-D-erythritol 2,4-cyclodiphosphate synthase [Comamonadaceae bacterium]|nr:2-C-methyl-D-erythritol 2,4-cyclodiphosphate synthase [Comamonadaceae bacterium]